MQKAIAPSQVGYYLERGYDRVSGFVHRATRSATCAPRPSCYAALGLDCAGLAVRGRTPTRSTCCAGRRYRPSLYRIPYGGQNEPAMRAMEGWVIERAPFRGNGFAPGESSDDHRRVQGGQCPAAARRAAAGGCDADGTEEMIAMLDARRAGWLAHGSVSQLMRDGFVARWQGRGVRRQPRRRQRAASTCPSPARASRRCGPGRYVRVLPVAEVDDLATCAPPARWRGQPFIVLAEHDAWLRVEYTGGRAPVARELGLEEFDFGVYQGWAPAQRGHRPARASGSEPAVSASPSG